MAATLLVNEEALEMYGSVLKADLSETLQRMLIKFAGGEELSLFSNEIKGIDALNWKPFPQALVVSEGCCSCDLILDRLTEIDGLLEYFSQ